MRQQVGSPVHESFSYSLLSGDRIRRYIILARIHMHIYTHTHMHTHTYMGMHRCRVMNNGNVQTFLRSKLLLLASFSICLASSLMDSSCSRSTVWQNKKTQTVNTWPIMHGALSLLPWIGKLKGGMLGLHVQI